MKLFEYQAKALFSKAGIFVPKSIVVSTAAEAERAAEEVKLPCMIKAQVLRGGRGKLGLVRRAKTLEETREIAKNILDSSYNVRRLLVEACVQIDKEVFVSISIDPVSARAMIMACSEGGVDIETVAKETPEKIVREYVSIDKDLEEEQLSDLVRRLGLSQAAARPMSELVDRLYRCFKEYDAELTEVNPVIITGDGAVAGDGKFIIDDNSCFRHPEFKKTRDYFDTDMEYESALEEIPYIQFDGDISLMCAGAGLTTTVYDLIHYENGTVANYLEFGGPNYMKGEKAMEICLANPSKVILIVTFGTIARADVIAEGVVKACERLRPDRPLITCIRGTNEDVATKMLKDAGIECFADTEDAVRRAVELTGRAGVRV